MKERLIGPVWEDLGCCVRELGFHSVSGQVLKYIHCSSWIHRGSHELLWGRSKLGMYWAHILPPPLSPEQPSCRVSTLGSSVLLYFLSQELHLLHIGYLVKMWWINGWILASCLRYPSRKWFLHYAFYCFYYHCLLLPVSIKTVNLLMIRISNPHSLWSSVCMVFTKEKAELLCDLLTFIISPSCLLLSLHIPLGW
jgi:hypothetical protein